ncbi:methionyl-tRNA formyltransferase, mitochondrial isoform X2 [Rhincodon typus]|uniref:methionyl-tRNA formyltransferase, mitochondrial isoform X2 n=1 Tax=Rhincodon typus TaxID=259920 RepID=UPI0009A29D83|nr:methionyl-tRNA formyltransferase, mitochondrial isoform X2 [Rhincodon typus]
MWRPASGLAWAAARTFPRMGKTVNRLFCAGRIGAHLEKECGRRQGRTAPPWRILFFGTDEFAQRVLEKLHPSRFLKTGKMLVQQLEVVTLPATKSAELPVRKYALMNQISVHDWPYFAPNDYFDVGIIVSFGNLLSETLIQQFPYGILNLHPSLLPRWRGPAPIFHTLIHGDQVTGVTIIQIRPTRFDVGPIVMQQECAVPPRCTADELGVILAETGAEMLLSTLESLPELVKNAREQSKEGITFAPKINVGMSWVNWQEQTWEELDQIYRAIGSRIPLRTLWMDKTVKLLDLVDVREIPVSLAFTPEQLIPGTIHFHKESNTLLVRCKNGWSGFKLVVLKKVLSAADFYNGYLHPYFRKGSKINQTATRFQTHKPEKKPKAKLSKRTGMSLDVNNLNDSVLYN